MELPPRTRRIHPGYDLRGPAHGTTSAYAENTIILVYDFFVQWNYLRVRGEYVIHGLRSVGIRELPPRTRRIRFCGPGRGHCPGTTSAYAENTVCTTTCTRAPRNYLRVRGEYQQARKYLAATSELPPRTRRILPCSKRFPVYIGTTSAYAENTAVKIYLMIHLGNYLRVRGEYLCWTCKLRNGTELPPRTRRIRQAGACANPSGGTTSAYAENTLNELGLL